MITLLFIQCKSVKSATKDQRSLVVEKEHDKERKDAANQQDTMFLYCNDFRGYLDNKTKNIVAYNNGTIEYCLREKAFLGDTASIRQVSELIILMYHPFGSFDKKLRGEKIFSAVLDRLNNFELIPFSSNPDDDSFPYFSLNSHILVEMIESIDGVKYGEYVEKIFPDKIKAYGVKVDLLSSEYLQTSCRIKWEIYKEAYDKGLIKLKDFGQE